MNKEEKAEFEREFEKIPPLPPFALFAMMPVSDPIEEVLKIEVCKGMVNMSREEMQAQLEDAGEELHLSYPYHTDVLETGVGYETTGWLIIYGIEILEGKGDATMSFANQKLLWLPNHKRRNYISTKGIIVPELTDFIIESEDNQPFKYRLVGEGNNNPKIEVYVERTYIRTQKMIDDDKEKVHVEGDK